jgi:disulfide bond formation protein DsbB
MSTRSAIDWLATLSMSRKAWIALAVSGIGLEVSALVFQYGLDLEPCVMCIYIRLAVLGLVLAGLVGAIAPGKPAVALLGFVVWAVAAVQGLVLSRELVAIQAAGPYSLEVTCSFLPNFPEWLPLHEWMPKLFMPTGSCTDETWTLFGLSMAQWLVGIFAAYIIILGLVSVSRLIARPARG